MACKDDVPVYKLECANVLKYTQETLHCTVYTDSALVGAYLEELLAMNHWQVVSSEVKPNRIGEKCYVNLDSLPSLLKKQAF